MNYKTFPRTEMRVLEVGFDVRSMTTNWCGNIEESKKHNKVTMVTKA